MGSADDIMKFNIFVIIKMWIHTLTIDMYSIKGLVTSSLTQHHVSQKNHNTNNFDHNNSHIFETLKDVNLQENTRQNRS